MADEVRVAIRTDADVVTARQEARAMGASLGFSSTDLTLLATAISEIARNITTYAGEGEIALRVRQRRAAATASRWSRATRGPGIADVELAMQDGYTTGNGLGLGLPGTRRLVDDFELETDAGRRHHDPAREVDPCLTAPRPTGRRGSSSASPSGRCAGECRSGDRAVLVRLRGRRARRGDRRARARRRRGRRRRRRPPRCSARTPTTTRCT